MIDLKNDLFQIIRKVAFKIVKNESEALTITADNVTDFVGKPIFTHDRIYNETPAGVVMGLAWTAMGLFLVFSSVHVIDDKSVTHF